MLEDMITKNNRFAFSAVKGDYGDKLITSLECIIMIDVPKQIRSQRVRDRSFEKYGDRILAGGDLFEKENSWFVQTDSRSDDYVTSWLETMPCPIIRIDGALPIEENVEYLVSALKV